MGDEDLLCFTIDNHTIHIEYHKVIQVFKNSLNFVDKKTLGAWAIPYLTLFYLNLL